MANWRLRIANAGRTRVEESRRAHSVTCTIVAGVGNTSVVNSWPGVMEAPMAGPNHDARENELRVLLRLIQASLSKDWTEERARIAVLDKLIVGRAEPALA